MLRYLDNKWEEIPIRFVCHTNLKKKKKTLSGYSQQNVSFNNVKAFGGIKCNLFGFAGLELSAKGGEIAP